MSEERKKVLEMLVEGKINAEEAGKLLDKLAGQPVAQTKTEESSSSSASPSSKPRFLRIVVDKPGHDQINVRVPLSFARTAPLLFAVLPTRVREKLAEQGIDLSETSAIDPKDWATAIETMNIDVEKGDGKKVRVFCE
jgi:SHOCT-like domain